MQKMSNIVVNNFLPDADLGELQTLIIKEKNTRIVEKQVGDHNDPRSDYNKYAYITESMGRLTLRDFRLPNHIMNSFIDYIESDLGISRDSLENRGAMVAEYSSVFGKPQLAPHYDSGETTVLLDFQVSSNTDWPIVIEDEEYILKDNSLISIYPTNQQHWRSRKNFNGDEYVTMVFIIFHVKGMLQNELDNELLDKRKLAWHE